MSTRSLRRFLIMVAIALVPTVAIGASALADITDSAGNNIHEGDAEANAQQGGSSASGDAVGGQVGGLVVSGGSASVDAKNRSEDADVASGDANGSNSAAAFIGQSDSDVTNVSAADITNIDAQSDANLQEGDNTLDLVQAADASSGDAVGGQVIGAVVSAGTTEIVADNTSEDVDAETGESIANNDSASRVGQDCAGDFIVASDIEDVTGNPCNVQDGDNDLSQDQSSASDSGDVVGGQVIGGVSAGDTSIDARNASEDVDLESGLVEADNSGTDFVGHNCPGTPNDLSASDVSNVPGSICSAHDGDNAAENSQSASAASGDGVGGQVIGAVTAAGGSNEIVAANTSEDVDAETGVAFANNDEVSDVGHTCPSNTTLTADVDNIGSTCSAQDGDQDSATTQTSDATSGDGVGGQVIGSVSAGDASIDADNASEDVDLETGASTADNSSVAVVAQDCPSDLTITASDVTDVDSACSAQHGDNSGETTQDATAGSGDAVGGEVVGAVTSAGGATDIVAANASEDVDVETGESVADNDSAAWTGMGCTSDLVATSDVDDIDNSCGVQDGDNDQMVAQTSDAASGDGVGGQVIGAVSAGDTSIDADNTSTDVDLETGVASADNSATAFVGQPCESTRDLDAGGTVSDVTNVESSCAAQDGDNDGATDQAAAASTGDAVGGEVIGAVTAAGGSNDIVAANDSEDVGVDTGDATANNDSASITGLDCSGDAALTADVDDIGDACGVQDGDNDQSVTQSADANSGDGVGGHVIGSVSAGDTSIDASNGSTDVDLDTGVATADNSNASHVGHACPSADAIEASDVTNVDNTCSAQDGDNSGDTSQSATASSGDAVGGGVIGAVTAAGGSNDIVADNDSEDVDVATGDATADNDSASFSGHDCPSDQVISADLENIVDFCTAQEGDNDLSVSQAADAASGDGVGGQVVGSVSAGDTSIDARNSSEDVDVDTGEADATNSSAVFVGLNFPNDNTITASDISGVSDGAVLQEGDNEAAIDQTATASSGDGVGGQVVGAVTSAGGSAEIVAENASEDVDIDSGAATADNASAAFVGLNDVGNLTVDASDIEDVDGVPSVQEGDNEITLAQTADAASGDGVGGQVVGLVTSGGSASVDAANESTDVDLESGTADATNLSSTVAGLVDGASASIGAADIDDVDGASNVLEGDNTIDAAQTASASTGDAVAGQVVGGVVTGGVTDAVLANASEDVDASTGETTFTNDDQLYVGLLFVVDDLIVG